MPDPAARIPAFPLCHFQYKCLSSFDKIKNIYILGKIDDVAVSFVYQIIHRPADSFSVIYEKAVNAFFVKQIISGDNRYV